MGTLRLEDWQALLAERFAQLRRERDAAMPGSPIFALEHGLSLDEELPALQEAVRLAVARPGLPRQTGLPFVVYSAEIGYGYRGDEFWPGFEEVTPRWNSHGIDTARRFIRHCFEDFADAYGGARISGRWALWFKNIAWPITHAVLPTDLQRHLARLLYDYRHALTADLLDDHHELGQRLAQRSQDTSARFRNFAENSDLLGLVAAALLVGGEEETPLLTAEVLHRIVADLNQERQAGAWLLDARRAAVRVRRRGFLPRSSGAGQTSAGPTGPQMDLDARLTLRRSREGWKCFVVIPSHESLAHRFPGLRRDFERTRYRVEGVAGVQSVGALLYDRGPLPIDRWPSEDGKSILQVENRTAERLIALLHDQCRLRAGPWLFRIAEPGLAVESRNRSVRPGAEYLLLARERVSLSAIGTREVPLATSGVNAVEFTVPAVLGEVDIRELMAQGLSVQPEVTVRPAGLPPAFWDGEGLAEWSAGESPILAITSSHRGARVIASTDRDVSEFALPEGSDTVFFQIADLPPGSHALELVVLDSLGSPVAQGSFSMRIREPVDSASPSGLRQGLQVRCLPPGPSLTELWLGDSCIEVSGTEGERVHFDLTLTSFGGRRNLGRVSFSSALPVTVERWTELLRGARKDLEASIGQAEEMVLRAAHPLLGSTELRASRPFEPLRWVTGSDRVGPFARLINHSAEPASVYVRPPDHPGNADSVEYEEEMVLRPERGGLVVASCGDLRAAVVVAPRVSGGLDSLRLLSVRPTLQTGPRTASSVRRCVVLANEWGRFATPADASAEQIQRRVLDAIAGRLGGLIGGQHWWEVEHQVLSGSLPTSSLLIAGIGRGAEENRLARVVITASTAKDRVHSDPDDLWVRLMGEIELSSEREIARLVGRLARSPESVDPGDPLLDDAIKTALDHPAVFRLARLAALTVAQTARSKDSGVA